MVAVLALLIAVGGPPDWEAPEPGTYSESMPVVGVVSVDGVELADPGDRVAAFVGGEVRAVSGPSRVGDRRVFTLAVAGNGPADGEVYFRAYDAARDSVWDLQPDIPFDPSAPVGTAADPLVWTPLIGGGPPAWNADAADYGRSMSITAEVVRLGTPVTEAGAVLAAFLDGRVRGAAPLEELGSYGAVAFMTAYGDEGDGDLTFRLYLPSLDRTFAIETAVPFAPGGAVGSLPSPAELVVVDGPTLDGGEGWRMLAPAGASAPLALALGPVWTQGFPAATFRGGAPNVYVYDEPSGTYAAPLGEKWEQGRGRFVYVYADDNPLNDEPFDGGFPKQLPSVGIGPSGSFAFDVSRTEGNGEAEGPGWNLLGNPFARAVDWDEGWTRVDVSESVYVWDPAYLGGSYRVWNGSTGALVGGAIPAGSAFWVEALGPAPEVVVPASAQVGGVVAQGRRAAATPFGLTLYLTADDRPGLGSELFVSLRDGARAPGDGHDPFDAWALAPMVPDHLTIGAVAPDERLLAIDARPLPNGEQIEIPIALRAVESGEGRGAELRVSWPHVDLPPGWSAELIDTRTGGRADLVPGSRGSLAVPTASTSDRNQTTPRIRVTTAEKGRLTLRLMPPAVDADHEAERSGAVVGPWPNPSRGSASLRLDVASAQAVRVSVLDALGREVAVVLDGLVQSDVVLSIDTGLLASGIYVVHIKGERFTEFRQITVAK